MSEEVYTFFVRDGLLGKKKRYEVLASSEAEAKVKLEKVVEVLG